MRKSMEQTLDDLEFGGMKEGSFGIMPLAKAVLATYFPQEAEEWERTRELNPVKGGVVFPGVKYVWVGKKGQKTRKTESRGSIAIKAVAPEALEMLQNLGEPDAMDPLEKLVFVENNAERYALEHDMPLKEATIKLRLMVGLSVPEEPDDVDEEYAGPYSCMECGGQIEAVEDEPVPETCFLCRLIASLDVTLRWLENMEQEYQLFQLSDSDQEALGQHFAFDGIVPDLPAHVSGKPEKTAKEYPARQSRWHNNLGVVSRAELKKLEGPIDRAAPMVWFYRKSGKRPILHKELRFRPGERFFGARISEALYLDFISPNGDREKRIREREVGGVIDLTDRLRSKLEQKMAATMKVYGAPEKVATGHDREFFERLFLPLEGRA